MRREMLGAEGPKSTREFQNPRPFELRFRAPLAAPRAREDLAKFPFAVVVWNRRSGAHDAIEAMRAAMVRRRALGLPAPTDLLPAGRRAGQLGPRGGVKSVEDQREVPVA